jgi:hypothetical protein
MWYASNRLRSLRRSRAGTASLEFALVAIPFFSMVIAGADLGRYFLTQHELRTVTSAAARSMLVSCYPLGPSCTSVAAQTVPFLGSVQPTVSINTGSRIIVITSQHSFTFILPVWTSMNPLTISDTTSLVY